MRTAVRIIAETVMRPRPARLVLAAVVLQSLVAGSAYAQAARYVGAALSCTKSGCHQDQKKWSETEETAPNRHKDAFEQISRDMAKSAKDAQSIGLADPLSPTGRCVECHAPRNARFFKEGVSCEVCHGAGSRYETPHDDQPYMTVGYVKAIPLGMPDYIGKPAAWAERCIKCHFVAEGALVTAGHPSGDDFDLSVKYKIVSSPNGNHWKTKYDARVAEIKNLAKQFSDPIRAVRTKGTPPAAVVTAVTPPPPATPPPPPAAPPPATPPPPAVTPPPPPPATPPPPPATPPPPAMTPPPAMPPPMTHPPVGTPANAAGTPPMRTPDPMKTDLMKPMPMPMPPRNMASTAGAVGGRGNQAPPNMSAPAGAPPTAAMPSMATMTGLPRSPAALVAAVQGRAIELLTSLLSRNAVVPTRVRPPEPVIQYNGPDADLLRLQREALALALDALGTAPGNPAPAAKP